MLFCVFLESKPVTKTVPEVALAGVPGGHPGVGVQFELVLVGGGEGLPLNGGLEGVHVARGKTNPVVNHRVRHDLLSLSELNGNNVLESNKEEGIR